MKKYLSKIAIRYFYDSWGYIIYCSDDKIKFVGDVQMVNIWKERKFIFSFQDIVAFCRMVSQNDELMGTLNLKMITKKFLELSNNYNLDDESKSGALWILYIPVWVSAFFEFKLIGSIDIKCKKKLGSLIKADDYKKDIYIFLQSLNVYITRKIPEDNNEDLALIFLNNLIREM